MQTTSTAFRTAYEQAVSLRSLPRAIFEWSHNRLSETVTPSNGGDATVDETFPIASISYSMRGEKGLVKGRVGEARTYQSSSNTAPQYRTVGPSTNYKYWTSPTQSGPTGDITNVNPQVIYGASVQANKIVVGLETSWAAPARWSVSITTNGTTWTTVATNTSAVIDSKGRIVLYRQNNGGWDDVVSYDNPTLIRGVRFTVFSMNKSDAHANIIEVGARLERDLSSDVMSVSIDRNTDDHSQIFPTGLVTANTANVVLDNTTELFDNDNTASIYYGLLDTNVEVRLFLGVDTSRYGGPGMEYLPQGVFYTDSWAPDVEASTIAITCSDSAKFLQAIQMMPVLFQDRTPAQIIAEILGSVGFRNYVIDISNSEKQPRIPFVWFTGEDTVWDAMQSICSSTQSTLYTDELGVLRYVTRDKTFENAAGDPQYVVTAQNGPGTALANMQSVETQFEVEANKVVVNYRPLVANSRKSPRDKTLELDLVFGKRHLPSSYRVYDSIPIDSVLWKPEDTITLRGSELAADMTATQDWVSMSADEAREWHWEGFINIEGEVISYKGKQYAYWSGGTLRYAIVTNAEEQRQIDDQRSDLATRHKNYYTGRLVNVKRGQMGTEAFAHSRNLNGWSAWMKKPNTSYAATPRMTQIRSQMVLNGASTDNNDVYVLGHRGGFSDEFKVYGTRVKFSKTAYGQGTAGMFINLQSDRLRGYFIELNLSDYALKANRGEVRVYRTNADGTAKSLPNATADAYGKNKPIVKDNWIDIDVTFQPGSNTFNVYIDGQRYYAFTDPQGYIGPGAWGTFVRGHTIAHFEYFYVTNTVDGGTPDIEKTSFQNKVTGSFNSGYAERQEVSRDKNGRVNWFFDDFGPWLHEMRKFIVDFDKIPALDANIYLSNSWDAYVLEGNRTPFGATFWIANSSRGPAIISGEDPSVFINGGDIKQQLLVYGQLVIDDAESSTTSGTPGVYTTDEEDKNNLTFNNEHAIRKRGVVELTVDSRWIQSKSQAQALGDWIVKHWSTPVDVVNTSGFFNPAVQLGDLVALNHPDRNMLAADHRYHVVGVNYGFDQGISTSLTLRRVR